jgi:hypothetical protein
MEEIWKDINGYKGLYQISNLGRVKSLERKRLGKNGCIKIYKSKILKGCINNLGYDCYDLFDKNGNRKNVKCHFLVAYHFCNGYKEKYVVNHKNGIKSDNKITNLEWVSFQENIKHAFKNRLIVQKGHILLDTETGIFFESIGDAYRSKCFNFSKSHFKNMIAGKKKNTTGLIRV